MISHMLGLIDDSPPAPVVLPSRDPGAQMIAVKARLDALELACAGMWQMLKDKLGCSEDEIAAYIRAADAREGLTTGTVPRDEAYCPNCRRKLLTKARKKCLWCGMELPAPLE